MNTLTWVDGVPDDSPFGVHNLPYGVFTTAERPERRRIGVRIGEYVLDVAAVARALGAPSTLLEAPTLNPLMAGGRPVWLSARAAITSWLTEPAHRALVEPHLAPLAGVTLHLPFEPADYVDFYASEHHASNIGGMFRPGSPPLTPNWKHLPIGYHGRSGTLVVSGTPVTRPVGQSKAPDASAPGFGPCRRLDFEAEVGFVVGAPSPLGVPVPLSAFGEHVFGVCLVDDWSARDLQAWEYVPLGPFLGKSFATSLSPWIVPLDALQHARVRPPVRDVEPLPYLDDRDAEPWGLDLELEVRLNGQVLTRPPFASMYWTAAQQLAHMTSNGASLRTGDLFASGTVSGPERESVGSMIEYTWNGQDPVKLADGAGRAFLEDGDEVSISATAPGPGGIRLGLGEVTGRILPAVATP
ncbi:fumarylacetoacetase [Actinocrinis puniceicyclus]|uniref:fumarylacetoacetase n=1 Tax=Actinocrinis puniceicyclus TaxID=977794 RepID=A0A8J7WNS1_9ACTN|nr:fumarylacetoacetase [Actinocrinis puniceicyclus]MBS2964145.1 fumarylacetoacetase [Actinocrinis puniceicyclus]